MNDEIFSGYLLLQKISILLLTFQLLTYGNALKVLYLVPFPAPSHWFWLKNFAEELLKRGHEVRILIENSIDYLLSANWMEICFQVTTITNYKRPTMHPNYTEVIIDPPFNYSDCKFVSFCCVKQNFDLFFNYFAWIPN